MNSYQREGHIQSARKEEGGRRGGGRREGGEKGKERGHLEG